MCADWPVVGRRSVPLCNVESDTSAEPGLEICEAFAVLSFMADLTNLHGAHCYHMSVLTRGDAMLKNVVFSGLMGWVVLIVWTFVVNGMLGFRSGMDMNLVTNEQALYDFLQESIVEPGRYIVNPVVTPDGFFPGDTPVFSILYGGVGHESAGRLVLFNLVIGLLAMLIATWMLSQASDRVLASYPRKVLFFSSIGLLIAVFVDLGSYGIGNYPLSDALVLAAHSVVMWVVIGVAVAGRMKPEEAS